MDPRNPAHLSDAELLAAVKRLAGGERDATVDLIVNLAELDKRRLYLGAGFSSLFTYCTEALRLSEHAAYHRILAARMCRRFPIALRMLAEGSLNLTSVRLLAPHLTEENEEELFAAAIGSSKRELQELLARRFPQPDVATSIRKLPSPRPDREPPLALVPPRPVAFAMITAAATESQLPLSRAVPSLPHSSPVRPLTSQPRPAVTPLAADRYQISFTASAGTRDKLRLAQDLMRHTIPSGDPAAIFDEALTALLEKVARRKFGETRLPRADPGSNETSRHIPACVRRAVWLRDLGRCAFVSQDGRRCNDRGFVEFHHVVPYGIGGPHTVANISLRCGAHNVYEADTYHRPTAQEGVVGEAQAPYTSSSRSSELGPDRVESLALN